MSATAEFVYQSDLGTLERVERRDGASMALRVTVNHPATTPGWMSLVRHARELGYYGKLNCLDFYPDGSEAWVIYPEVLGDRDILVLPALA